MSLTHQFWPKLDNEACRTVNTSVACVYNSLPDYRMVSASGSIRFKDNYTVNFGIENLLDTDPPCRNSNPTLLPTPQAPFQFPQTCSHIGGGAGGDAATYDPLGRRYYISMNFEF